MRAIWKGRIGFGLIGLEAKLYKAVDEGDIGFHLVHSCGARIKYQNFCAKCEKVVERSELKKGYEIAKDQFVMLEEADFQKLPLASVKSINIEGFTDDGIDPRAFDASYLLAPEKGSANEKPFALLYKAMETLNVKAVGKLAYRDKEHLCLISAYQGVFLLQTLFYADELRPFEDLKPKGVALSDKETELGMALVNQLKGVFAYDSYSDQYRQALEKLIEAKVEGKEVQVPAEQETPAGDLVSQLLASLNLKEAVK